LCWESEPKRRYEIERSSDLMQWNSGVPNSVFISGNESGKMSYTDSIGDQSSSRFYRLKVNFNE
jgi:hypothetical protein